MNLEQLSQQLEMEEDELVEMIQLFLEASASDLNRLRSAQAKGASAEAVRAVHSIKGAAISLGLMEIYQSASTIEREACGNRLDRVPQWIRTLQGQLDGVREDFLGGR